MLAMPERGRHGELYQGRYYGYEGNLHGNDLDLEAQEQDYAHQSYQPSPQDMPLLSGSISQEQLYDSSGDQAPFLQYRGPREPSWSNLNTTSLVEGARGAQPVEVRESIPLFRGNLVFGCPVPPKLLGMAPGTQPPQRDEFTHMRYTAATCDPADFFNLRFTLRQQLFEQPRSTDLFIIVTMYNENDVLFARTMAGVFQNIQFMCNGKGKHGGSLGKDGWKRIVVCVVSDGRAKLHSRTAAVLTALGVYQRGIIHQNVGEKGVTAHIYEYTTKVSIEIDSGIVKTKPGMECPVQMIFCLKEKNQKKINSHRWAFQAFGAVLKPDICVLLDAGTRPGPDSIYHLWRAFDIDHHCAGACGEIRAMIGEYGRELINPLVAAQNFEYKMSNILDKPMESAFGFISVLPGAFSAYRFLALQNGPLQKYFAGEKMAPNAGIFANNMYLAEDRILCFELVAKHNAKWVLAYVKSAIGETDVPEKMSELIKQRRRWLNGSFFASIYALTHFYQIFESSHSIIRKTFFIIEFLYQLISMIFAWFAVGNFFLVFQILTTSLGGPELLGDTGEVLSVIIEWIYLGSLATCFVLSLGNTPDGSKGFYMAMAITWAGIML
jgi:chitin synthase